MARIDVLTGKKPITGHSVSHSNVKTNRWFAPNLQKKRFYIPELDKWVTMKVATSTIRTMNKLGVYAYLKKLQKQGVDVGIKL
ncbi:MAG TPA: 50S ribosomal protein L28 [Saprospirales bacterium]|nr:50S ribosomal protein L28 [Saprospirales bacterium]HAY71780.1 50S ribosomal protein L28 [Saprospirales bacterium]HRQ29822.1 50S ribosomal protein L28 [Saprospiraceae bacterium]